MITVDQIDSFKQTVENLYPSAVMRREAPNRITWRNDGVIVGTLEDSPDGLKKHLYKRNVRR